MSELNKQIFERINNLLKKKKCKQIELTNYLNLNKNAYSYWKNSNGNSYMSYLAEIADFFDVSIDFLVCGKTNEFTENEKEMLLLFQKFSEREQLKLICKIEEMLEAKKIKEKKVVGKKIARRTDGEAVRTNVTAAELELMEQLPEETEF